MNDGSSRSKNVGPALEAKAAIMREKSDGIVCATSRKG